MKKIIVTAIILLAFTGRSLAQSLAINTDGSTANASALLDVKSTSKGVLIPRMNKTQKNSIPSPATGLLIFQNAPDSVGFHYYDGSAWNWLANAAVSQNWLTVGNSDVTASSYLGTNNTNDLRFAVNTFERSRISNNSGFWGFGGETNPQYDLDVSLGAAGIFPCTRNGLRVKPTGFSNNCDNGFFVGLDNNASITNASVWNYGNNGTGAQNIRVGLNSNEVSRFTSDIAMGLGETSPQYTLDMRIGMAAIFPCTRNGLRINIPGNPNSCDKGLFLGYDDNTLLTNASFWNFGDGSFGNSFALRFGLGGDFTNGEKMRITSDGVGIGSTSPIAKLHIIDRTGSLLPGVMVTNTALPPSTNGFYTGLKDNTLANTGRIWNYQNADIELGTNDLQRVLFKSDGTVGIGTTVGASPNSTLQVDGTIAIGVSMSISGGTIITPGLITTQKSYLGLSPAGGTDYYQLPSPVTSAGRIYYIRNNDNAVSAWVGTVAGLICPGNGNCLAFGSYYELQATGGVKTIIAISDGVNWTVGKID
ncbi:MAG: hypothetical protein IPP31_07215 [Chitinophagaceae bacterium]|nr:hypothetical protein [Chitinophagaceae bacterium]